MKNGCCARGPGLLDEDAGAVLQVQGPGSLASPGPEVLGRLRVAFPAALDDRVLGDETRSDANGTTASAIRPCDSIVLLVQVDARHPGRYARRDLVIDRADVLCESFRRNRLIPILPDERHNMPRLELVVTPRRP